MIAQIQAGIPLRTGGVTMIEMVDILNEVDPDTLSLHQLMIEETKGIFSPLITFK